MEKNVREVFWGRKYPKEITTEGEKLKLIRKNWGFRLIYDVYKICPSGDTLLGTCHVMENAKHECNCEGTCKKCKCRHKKYVVRELVSNSPELKKRIEEITESIRENL